MQQHLAEVTAENVALRQELNAFDPEFFDEIEDLKFERYQLAEQVKRYKARISGLAEQLNIEADLS